MGRKRRSIPVKGRALWGPRAPSPPCTVWAALAAAALIASASTSAGRGIMVAANPHGGGDGIDSGSTTTPRVIARHPYIHVADDVLTDAECAALLAAGEASGFAAAHVAGQYHGEEGEDRRDAATSIIQTARRSSIRVAQSTALSGLELRGAARAAARKLHAHARMSVEYAEEIVARQRFAEPWFALND